MPVQRAKLRFVIKSMELMHPHIRHFANEGIPCTSLAQIFADRCSYSTKTDIQYQGIPGYRYSIGENFINDIGPEHDNECFCVDKLANVIKRKNGCLYAGALDLTTCLGELLYYIQQIHFSFIHNYMGTM